MIYERYMRVQVVLKNGERVDGNLIKEIPMQQQLLVMKDGSLCVIRNQGGVLIYLGPAKTLFIERDKIDSFDLLN
jgi:hypothetical protein